MSGGLERSATPRWSRGGSRGRGQQPSVGQAQRPGESSTWLPSRPYPAGFSGDGGRGGRGPGNNRRGDISSPTTYRSQVLPPFPGDRTPRNAPRQPPLYTSSSAIGLFSSNESATIDPRLSDSTQDALIGGLTRLQARNQFPHRPGWGTVGTAVTLQANHFPISYPNTKLYDYVVKVEPKPTIRRIRRRIFQLLEAAPEFAPFKNHVVHDSGGRLISSRALPIPPNGIDIVIRHYDEDEEGPGPRSFVFTINIAYNTHYLSGDPDYRDFDALPIISAFNIIIAQHPSRTGINVGRNRFFFPHPSSTQSLGAGLEALKGFYSSVRPTVCQLMLNVNSCTTVFYQAGNLASAMVAYQAGGGGRFAAFVKGLRIQTTHLGFKSTKTIKRVGDLSARRQTFICEEYGHAGITVEHYFFRKYNIQLLHPTRLPVIGIGPSADKPIWLPAEVCSILPHQPFRGKLPDHATKQMIQYACSPPDVNADNIVQQGLRRLGLQDNAAPSLREFGVNVGNKMAIIPARILPPPSIVYGRGVVRVDEKASWNLRDVQFIDPRPLQDWAVLTIADGGKDDFKGPHDPRLTTVINNFIEVCRRAGIAVRSDPATTRVILPPKDHLDPTRRPAIEALRAALVKIRDKASFVLVMLSSGDKHIYTGLKTICDLDLDLHTVCCLSQKVQKQAGQLQYFANIAQKINMKLGGTNHTLDHNSLRWLLDEPTILFGSDVTHPSPGSLKGTPSIAAVVASVDNTFAHYPASLRLQESRKEMITDLASIVEERLEQYRGTSRSLPKRIVFFRDGVSEGQFLTVTQEELPKIREGCARMLPNAAYRPKITICIAGKRHHTRFYPVDSSGADKNGNPLPGTVVDRGVTAIYDFDFFLQAHSGIQGTTRPTHYCVVHDENGFDADSIQRLTNATSYMFGRATRAVSVIPPAFYADLACERGRCYIHEFLTAGDVGIGDFAESTEQEVFQNAKKVWGRGVGPKLKSSMFYL